MSPYVKHQAVDSSLYNTTSILRTMELMLGLRPMTHFDAGARHYQPLFSPLRTWRRSSPSNHACRSTSATPRIQRQRSVPPGSISARKTAPTRTS
jgi:hypothetical protein